MIYNRYESTGSIKEFLRNQLNRHPNIFDFIFQRTVVLQTLKKLEKRAFPAIVEIETINRCNNTCSFCPVSKGNDRREYAIMDEGLFRRIIEELKLCDYKGVLGLYSNNEPLLDDRLPEFAHFAKHSLPKAHILLFTNGILLESELFFSLIDYVDELVIDNYSDSLKMIKPVQKLYDDCIKNTPYEQKVTIQLRKLNEVLNSRGGDAPNVLDKAVNIPKTTCLLPFAQCVIRPDGKVSLCCNDAYGKFSLGDVNNQTIAQIWNGGCYKKLRTKLKQGRHTIEMCSLCDNRLMSIGYIKKGLGI